MEPETVAAVTSAIAAVAASGAAGISLPFTRRAANAARDQTELQRTILEQANQPYVWADIRMSKAQGLIVVFVVGNSGPTIATDVAVTVDPPLPTETVDRELTARAFDRLREGIKAIAPGRTIEWSLGVSHRLLKEEGSQPFTITVNGNGPHGPLSTLRYVIDLSDFRESNDSPTGSLHQLTKAVKDVEKKL